MKMDQRKGNESPTGWKEGRREGPVYKRIYPEQK